MGIGTTVLLDFSTALIKSYMKELAHCGERDGLLIGSGV